jgi:hypothetical protein
MEIISIGGADSARSTAPTCQILGSLAVAPSSLLLPAARVAAHPAPDGEAVMYGVRGQAAQSHDARSTTKAVAVMDLDIQGATGRKFWNRVGPPAGRSPV